MSELVQCYLIVVMSRNRWIVVLLEAAANESTVSFIPWLCLPLQWINRRVSVVALNTNEIRLCCFRNCLQPADLLLKWHYFLTMVSLPVASL